MLEACHSGAGEEGANIVEIFISPIAAQAWRAAKGHSAAFAGLGVYAVHFVANPAAGEQRVAAHFDAFGVGIINKFLVFGNVFVGDVLGIQSRAEAQYNHFVAALGALVDGLLHGFGLCACEVHEYRVLRSPRRNGALHAAIE